MVSDLQSVHTNTFAQILEKLRISIIVSTYQAGKVIILRSDNGVINTHFRNFSKPMGMAVSNNRLAIGSSYQIWDLRNIPAVAQKLPPQGKHDACYLPRKIHLTGDIDIHEMSYTDEQLWFINTKFSCLCTLDQEYSFVPQWRPPFVTAYDTNDRCHLNGLAIRDNQPKYITALGTTDTPQGWRENKARGGIIMDITNNEFICQGLSMPHSPRWYQEKLWVLESGDGSIAQVDTQTGKLNVIAQLPGFTRGIDFYGDIAFIGLSKVRESAVFSGIPITQRLTERICGVWVVNITTGNIIAFLRFTTGVEEIFAVQVLPGQSFPDIINDEQELLSSSYVIPDEALAEVAQVSPMDIEAAKQKEFEANKLTSFAVVIPIKHIPNQTKLPIKPTLESIEASINYFQKHHKQADSFSYEVIIVDDTTGDETENIIKPLIEGKSYYRYLRHYQTLGFNVTKNTGVNAANAEAIFYCEAGNLFLPVHILTCINTLNQALPENTKSLMVLRGNYPAVVKTKFTIENQKSSYNLTEINESLLVNTCIRKQAHDFIEGFPNQEVFKLTKRNYENYVYLEAFKTCFYVVEVEKETVVTNYQYIEDNFNPNKADNQYLPTLKSIFEGQKAALVSKAQIKIKPDEIFMLGNQAFNKGDFIGAEKHYKHCLFLHPEHLHAMYNLGVTYLEQEAHHAAERILLQVIKLEPNYAEAYNNLGNIYNRRNQLSTAINYYHQAIERRYQFPDAHFNLAMTLLQLGDFKKGWEKHEWRWQRADFTPFKCPQPQWQGEDRVSESILVHTEQGAGDTIQFIRYIPLIASKFKSVILCCPENLVRLLETIPEIEQIYTPGEIPNTFAVYSPLMSLPYCLGTTLESIPANIPYLGAGLNNKQLSLKLDKLIDKTKKLKIGIVWAGSPTHTNDRHRSCNLNDLLPLLYLPELEFYSLQKGPKSAQIAELPSEINLTDLSNYLGDYADTAIALGYLDLVITVDTSVAHLAGALGKPVWTLLSFNHDWRWLVDREDSPWYPTMKLFHQSYPHDWPGVIKQVVKEINCQYR